ncbi:hypothetical protein CPB83DRAFT_894798 [Crepidotus variabilis]|uniref:DUF6532 domain-containing protein n=1 Tax=Crepidotus variabilis TaxID=179855 RepID=A0A9P6EF67_9AGAR|nr:hypothetical protein CPB83DRAFT_894798 [Crepidotus variabilis]
MPVHSKPVTDIPNAAEHRPAQTNANTSQRQRGQSKTKGATDKENLLPAAPATASMRPVCAGAGKNMAMLIQHEKSGSDEDLSARKRKRNPREPAEVTSTLTSGVPTNTTENPMAPPKKKQRNKASGGQAATAPPSIFDSSLMGAPVPTNVEPLGGQFNSIHAMSSESNTQGLANRALPNTTTQMSPNHMQPVDNGLSQQSSSAPMPNAMVSHYTPHYYPTSTAFNVNEHQGPSANGFFNEHSTGLSFNMNDASGFEGQQHYDNFFGGLANQDQGAGADIPSFNLEQDALLVSGKTDLMLPSVNPGTFGEEDSETKDKDKDDPAGDEEAGDDEGQAAGDEYSATEDESEIVASQRDVGDNMADLDDGPLQANTPLLQPHEIDEQSPSEDERQALAILSRPQESLRDATPSRDVIEEHRRRNRATKPPSEERLLAAAQKQLRQARANNARDSSIEVDSDEGEGVQQRVRATRNSKPSNGPNPKNLNYYPDMWKAAIGDSKIFFQKIIALETAFPTKEADLSLASQCLAFIIAEFKDKGLVLEEGYQQTRTMDGIVFAKGTTYRGKLKKMASDHVVRYYADDLKTTKFFNNQQGHLADIAAKVEKLVGMQSMFHKDGVDEQGRANNFMHPCIRDLCIKFFYSKEHHGLAHHYPDNFKDIIPERAVALVTTAIRCALDEYKSGEQKQVDFTANDYLKVYQMTLQMMEVINSKPHRQAKWKECRRQWASAGWAKYAKEEVNDAILTIDVSD